MDKIELLRKSVLMNTELMKIAEKYHKEDYNIFYVSDDKNENFYEHKIMYLNAVIDVLSYAGSESISFGKYFKISFNYCGNLRCGLYLEDSETENKLYNYAFGSHSGINDFFAKHFPKIISPILGYTKYSYAFGSCDLSEVFTGYDHFGKDKNGNYHWSQEDYDKDIKRVKSKIDFLRKLTANEELMHEIDELLEKYFELIFKHNCEE